MSWLDRGTTTREINMAQSYTAQGIQMQADVKSSRQIQQEIAEERPRRTTPDHGYSRTVCQFKPGALVFWLFELSE